MKKTCAVILAAAVAFASMAGCGKKAEETETAAKEAGTEVLEETTRLAETAEEAETTQAQTDGETEEAGSSAEVVKIRLGGLKGPTSMGMVKLLDDAEQGKAKSQIEFTMAISGDELAPKLLKGELDVAAVPANLASVLYHNSEGAVQFAAVNTLGVLYIAETGGEEVQSVADLKGQTIYATGKGTTPEYALRYLLSENGVDPDGDVTIEWMSEPTETVAKMAQADHAVAMLPQPFVTVAGGQLENFRVALDLTEEWDKLENGSRLITAGLVVRREFAENHPEELRTFLEEYEASTAYLNENLSEGAALVEKYDIVKAAVAEKAISGCNVTYLAGEEMKAAVEGYLKVLFDANPKAVGGSLPDDGFYLVLP
ncbi:MAG: ABC transporter substrate-binding protein [Lachnospiraceae bacterium]|nr:ABC transporter substrate-binding protein [Lachnospiraceae bacterium]